MFLYLAHKVTNSVVQAGLYFQRLKNSTDLVHLTAEGLLHLVWTAHCEVKKKLKSAVQISVFLHFEGTLIRVGKPTVGLQKKNCAEKFAPNFSARI